MSNITMNLTIEELEDLLTVTEFAAEQLAEEEDEDVKELTKRISNIHGKLLRAQEAL